MSQPPEIDRDDDWCEICPDFALLSPTTTNISFKNLSSDIICYIIFQYLDYKTIITSCILLNKDYYRKIANNRFLFINMYNDLFINRGVTLSSAQLPVLFHPSASYQRSNELSTNCQRMLLQSGRMTDEKLKYIKQKWQESINKKITQRNPVKNEKQILLNIIKKMIKDRLDILKFFRNEFDSSKIGDVQMKRSAELIEETQNILQKLNTFEELSLGDPTSHYFHESFINYIKEQEEAYEPIELDNIISIRDNANSTNYVRDFCNCSISMLKYLKNLKFLYLTGYCDFKEPVKLNNLKVLIIRTGAMPNSMLQSILNCSFPQLKHLELWLGSPCQLRSKMIDLSHYNNDITENDLTELLSESENGKYPILEYFGLRNTYNISQFLPLIMKSSIVKRVRVLDLSLSGNIKENDALFIAEQIRLHRKEFTLLEFVDLSYNQIQLYNNPNNDTLIQQIEDEFNKMGIAVNLSLNDRFGIAEH